MNIEELEIKFKEQEKQVVKMRHDVNVLQDKIVTIETELFLDEAMAQMPDKSLKMRKTMRGTVQAVAKAMMVIQKGLTSPHIIKPN